MLTFHFSFFHSNKMFKRLNHKCCLHFFISPSNGAFGSSTPVKWLWSASITLLFSTPGTHVCPFFLSLSTEFSGQLLLCSGSFPFYSICLLCFLVALFHRCHPSLPPLQLCPPNCQMGCSSVHPVFPSLPPPRLSRGSSFTSPQC